MMEAEGRNSGKKLLISFLCALKGISTVTVSERNFRIHLFALAFVIPAGFFFGITAAEWLAVIIVSGSVLSLEMVNTTIEKLTNLVSPGFSREAGMIKDIAAGAVLIAAIAAVITGLIIFVPRIIHSIQ